MGARILRGMLVFTLAASMGANAEEPKAPGGAGGEGELERLQREREALDRRIAELRKKGPADGGKRSPMADENGKVVVVTATRVETPIEQVGSSVSVLTEEDIRTSGSTVAQDALRRVPGLFFARTGARGGLTSLFTRGGESDYTSVLLDGFKINNDGGQFDWEYLSTDNVGRIEVLRGAAGTPWGSDAIAGVVNLISKRGEGPATLTLGSALGNRGTFREKVDASAGEGRWGYSLAFTHFLQDDGFFENSDVKSQTFAGRFDVPFGEDTDVMLVARNLRMDNGVYTTSAGQRFEKPDPNDYKERTDILNGAEARTQVTERWVSTIRTFRYYYSRKSATVLDPHPRQNESGGDTFGSVTHTNYDRMGTEWQNRLEVLDAAHLVLGVENEQEWVDTTSLNEGRNNLAGYAQVETAFDERLFVTAGGRVDQNSDFTQEKTGRLSAAWLLNEGDTKLRTSAGTGIKVPTFTEIFGFGTTPGLDRRPEGIRVERSRTVDAGVDQRLFDGQLRLSATGFYNRYDELVEYQDSANGYDQGGQAFARGAELEAAWTPSKKWDVSAGWTNLGTRVTATRTGGTTFIVGDKLVRRPSNQGSATVRHRPMGDDTVELALMAFYVGDRDDLDFYTWSGGFRANNPEYYRVDASASWRFLPGWRLFGSGQNLNDEEYEEIFGHPSDGPLYLAGIEYSRRF